MENTMHRAVLLAQGDEIEPDDIMLDTPGGQSASDNGSAAAAAAVSGGLFGKTVAEVERDPIIETLQHCLGKRNHAANILGLSIRTHRKQLTKSSEEGVTPPKPGQARRGARGSVGGHNWRVPET